MTESSYYLKESTFFSQEGWKRGTFCGTNYRYLSIKPADRQPTFLLMHGYPSGPLSYRTLIPQLTATGCGVLLPELLGYGETDKPEKLEDYAHKKQCNEIAAMMDKEGIEKVIVVGHDLGAPLATRFAAWYIDRCLALIAAASPYSPPGPTGLNPDALLKYCVPVVGYENVGYIKFLSRPDASEVINEHLDSFLSIMYGNPDDWKTHLCATDALEVNLLSNFEGKQEPWFSDHAMLELTAYLRETGMECPSKWFQLLVSNVDVADEKEMNPRIKIPYLFLSPQRDPTYPPPISSLQNAFCDDLATMTFPNGGHWLFEQDPKGASKAMFQWLGMKGIHTLWA